MGRKTMLVHTGTPSVLILFAVLCLTVFAVLSLLSARSQASLAGKFADAVSAYYAADTQAVEIFDQICTGNLPECVTVFEDLDGRHYRYDVPIDENQVLSVLVRQLGEAFEILSWKVSAVSEWESDGQINLWDGN